MSKNNIISHVLVGPDAVIVDGNDAIDEKIDTCSFLSSPEIQSNITKKIMLGKKCLKSKSPKYVFGYGARSISVNDFKCGISNDSTIEKSDLCAPSTTNKLSKNHMNHTLVYLIIVQDVINMQTGKIL